MKFKNILAVFSVLIIALGFYSLSQTSKTPNHIIDQIDELEITEYDNGSRNYSYNKNKKNLIKRNDISKQRIKKYQKSVQIKSDLSKKNDLTVVDDSEKDPEEELSKNTENKEEDEEANEGEEEVSEDETEKKDNQKISKTNPKNNILKDYKSFEASSVSDETLNVGTQFSRNSKLTSQETATETETLAQEESQNIDNQTNRLTPNDSADTNDGFANIDLSSLDALIEEGDYEGVQALVNSSNLSAFKREALNTLVFTSFSTEDPEQRNKIESIIISTYFNNENLNLYTVSMVESEISFEERSYMGSLLTADVYSAPGRLTQSEFIELYFNGIRSALPTPSEVNSNELADLYLKIDFSIEESFATYSSDSRVASDQ